MHLECSGSGSALHRFWVNDPRLERAGSAQRVGHHKGDVTMTVPELLPLAAAM